MAVIGIDPDIDTFHFEEGDSATVAGLWFRSGIEIRQQVSIGAHRADFVFAPIGGRRQYVVEMDGHRYHSAREDLRRDKSRDRELQAQGFSVLRFTYDEVWPDPGKAACAAREIVLRGDVAPEQLEAPHG